MVPHQRHGAALKRVPIVGVKATVNPPVPAGRDYRGVLALHSAPYGNHVGGIYFSNPSVASGGTGRGTSSGSSVGPPPRLLVFSLETESVI